MKRINLSKILGIGIFVLAATNTISYNHTTKELDTSKDLIYEMQIPFIDNESGLAKKIRQYAIKPGEEIAFYIHPKKKSLDLALASYKY